MLISPRFRTAPVIAGFLLLGLSACNSQPENIEVGPTDDQKEALAHAKPVELPPSIVASKSYRCKDNSLVFIDWFSDNKSATMRAKKTDSPTMVKADAPATPMTAAGGYALDGSATAATISATMPGKAKQDCKS